MTYQNRAPAFSIGVPTPPLLAVLTGCRNSRTARTLRRVSVLCSAASSCRNRGSTRGFSRLGWSAEPTLLSLSWCQPGVRHPPRVVIVVPARGSTSSSSHYRGSNRGFSRLNWSAEPTLLSLLWYKPGVRLPPRVANVVQTVACSRCSRWGGGIPSFYG